MRWQRIGSYCCAVLFVAAAACVGQMPSDPPVPESKPAVCPIPAGSFAHRTHIDTLWGRKALDQKSALEQLERIDARYNSLQHALSDAYYADTSRLLEMCNACSGDAIADAECAVLALKREPGRKDVLGSIANERERIHALAIAQYPTTRSESGFPKAFRPDGPASTYLELLLRLASGGDQDAFSRLLVGARVTEGELGEDWADKMAHLWGQHPDLYAKNWPSLLKSRAELTSITPSLSIGDIQAILRFARHECTVEPEVCGSMARYVERRGPQERTPGPGSSNER